MGAKIQIKNESIHNFGRFFICIDHFRKSGLAKLADNTLGIKVKFARYSYAGIAESLMAVYLTGELRRTPKNEDFGIAEGAVLKACYITVNVQRGCFYGIHAKVAHLLYMRQFVCCSEPPTFKP